MLQFAWVSYFFSGFVLAKVMNKTNLMKKTNLKILFNKD